jgi:hypothetical protein
VGGGVCCAVGGGERGLPRCLRRALWLLGLFSNLCFVCGLLCRLVCTMGLQSGVIEKSKWEGQGAKGKMLATLAPSFSMTCKVGWVTERGVE